MRIIVTDKGEVMKKDIKEETKKLQKEGEDQIRKEILEKINSPLRTRNVLNNNKALRGGNVRFRSYDFSTNTLSPNLQGVKQVTVNDKISIPKNDFERYNKDESTRLVLSQFPEALLKKQENLIKSIESSFEKKNIQDLKSLQGIYLRRQLPVREIINQDSYTRLIEEIEKRNLMRERAKHVSEVKFRTPFKKTTKIQEIDENLNKMVDCVNTDLIQYLNKKSVLPEQLLTNLKRFDEEKLSKTNKICQKLLKNNKNFEEFQLHIKEKISMQKNVLAEEETVNTMLMSCMKKQKSFNEIMEDYKVVEKPRFDSNIEQIHREFKRNFWDKYNADFLQRKGSGRTRSIDTLKAENTSIANTKND